MNFRGIVTKLELKAILYIKGISKKELIRVINMDDYFNIQYKKDYFIVTTSIDKTEVNEVIKNHFQTLLTVQY